MPDTNQPFSDVLGVFLKAITKFDVSMRALKANPKTVETARYVESCSKLQKICRASDSKR